MKNLLCEIGMLDEIFLHVGMHKTGSSTIQIALDGYDDGTTFYADLGSPNHSLALRTAFDPYPEQIHPHIERGRSRSEIDRLKGDYLSTLKTQVNRPRKRMILSAEGVCDLADEGITIMRDWLTTYADKVTIFAYLREPIAFVNSYFAESVKHGLTEFTVPSPEYSRRLGRFREVFPTDNVHFKLFDPRNFDSGSLLADFCKIAEVNQSKLPDEMRSNESLSFEATQILFALNRQSQNKRTNSAHVHTLRNVRKALLVGEQSKFRLCGDIVQSSIHQEDLDWFEQETHQRIDTYESRHNTENSVRDLDDLLSLRPSTKTLLWGVLRGRGIKLSQDDPSEGLAKLYDTFNSEEVGPQYKRIFKKIRKSLWR